MTPQLKLYYRPSTCSIAPHTVLRHFDIPVTLVLMRIGPEGVESDDGTISHAEYLKIHHEGYIPALEVDGEAITEIPAIFAYISSLVPEAKLLGNDGLEQAKVIEWLTFLSGTLHGRGYGMVFRPLRFSDDENTYEDTKVKGKAFVRECYEFIDSRLKGKTFAVGDRLTAVDFNLYVFARWGVAIGIDMKTDFPNYAAHARHAESLKGVKEAMELERLEFRYRG